MSPRVLEKKALRTKTAGGPGPPYTIRTPLREGLDTPPGGSGAATCPQAQVRARLLSFLGKTCPPTAFNAGDVKCALPEETFARLYCWSCVTKVHSIDASATHATRVSLIRQLDTTTRRRSIITPMR